jgi:hypothetical protein
MKKHCIAPTGKLPVKLHVGQKSLMMLTGAGVRISQAVANDIENFDVQAFRLATVTWPSSGIWYGTTVVRFEPLLLVFAIFMLSHAIFLASGIANNTKNFNSRYVPHWAIEPTIYNQTAINHSTFGLQLNQLSHDSRKLQSTQSRASESIELIVGNSDTIDSTYYICALSVILFY